LKADLFLHELKPILDFLIEKRPMIQLLSVLGENHPEVGARFLNKIGRMKIAGSKRAETDLEFV